MMIKELCATLGISRPTLHHWDRGNCMPSPRYVEKIRKLTDDEVTAHELHEHWLSKQKKEAA